MSPNDAKTHYLDLAQELLAEVESGANCSELAAKLGWSASKVRHHVRLARSLSPDTEDLCLRNPELSIGHAKVLASLPPGKQIELARTVLAKRWSVRQLEQHQRAGEREQGDKYYQQLSESLSEQLGHPLSIRADKSRPGNGVIAINYYGSDDFDAICARLGVAAGEDY